MFESVTSSYLDMHAKILRCEMRDLVASQSNLELYQLLNERS